MKDPVIEKIAKAHGKTGVQVLVRWAIQRGTICIPKSNNPERIKSNADVFDFELTEEEIMGLVSEALTVPESIPGNGIRDVESGKFMGRLPQYQSVEEAKPRKEDEAYSGKGSIVSPHDVSDADDVEGNLADDEIDDCLEEEVIYEYDPEIMKIYMEAIDYIY